MFDAIFQQRYNPAVLDKIDPMPKAIVDRQTKRVLQQDVQRDSLTVLFPMDNGIVATGRNGRRNFVADTTAQRKRHDSSRYGLAC